MFINPLNRSLNLSIPLKVSLVKNQRALQSKLNQNLFQLVGKSTAGRKSVAKKTVEVPISTNNFYDPTQLAFKSFEKKLDDTKKVKTTQYASNMKMFF